MKHIFIVNPAAGPQDVTQALQSALCAFPGLNGTLYRTTCQGDATRYVRGQLASCKEPTRFYACGGDGTLNEVASGAAGFPHASVTCYPCGSGNDFVKYYGGKAGFLDIAALIDAVDHPIDLIKIGDHYAINACHFGFDTAVAATIAGAKRFPFIKGRGAYAIGVARALISAMRNRCKLVVDGAPVHEGEFLLCTIANGTHVGGSYKCAPRSLDDDGLLEICLVNPLSRFKFLSLIGPYQRGEHLDDARFRHIVCYWRARKIELSGPDDFRVSLDGEIIAMSRLTIEAVPRALNFAVPRALSPAASTRIA